MVACSRSKKVQHGSPTSERRSNRNRRHATAERDCHSDNGGRRINSATRDVQTSEKSVSRRFFNREGSCYLRAMAYSNTSGPYVEAENILPPIVNTGRDSIFIDKEQTVKLLVLIISLIHCTSHLYIIISPQTESISIYSSPRSTVTRHTCFYQKRVSACPWTRSGISDATSEIQMRELRRNVASRLVSVPYEHLVNQHSTFDPNRVLIPATQVLLLETTGQGTFSMVKRVYCYQRNGVRIKVALKILREIFPVHLLGSSRRTLTYIAASRNTVTQRLKDAQVATGVNRWRNATPTRSATLDDSNRRPATLRRPRSQCPYESREAQRDYYAINDSRRIDSAARDAQTFEESVFRRASTKKEYRHVLELDPESQTRDFKDSDKEAST
ncbi:hypothetical protein KIN20_020347 [Parelaphostrongylus tenuis]|uniref:Uncharacterized protein n=1 Tax=Parelaphostrongylus tenuis TaxID=148309 RepID=A0AAD5MMA5_PARTN|nr:hypothetical protein KIN20_020347 [Parelaphostrongylus tenuis]